MKPVISVQGLALCSLRKWWTMIFVCHAWYGESCAVSTTWYGLRPGGQPSQETLRIGNLTIDVAGHEVRRGDDVISLTPLEFELLVALASKPQQVFSREMLLEQVWGYHYKADTRLVNVHVQRLRAKVELDPDNPRIVTTVRGVGYRAGAVE